MKLHRLGLVISPMKSIFECLGDGITGYPSTDCSNFPVLYVSLKYWLSSTAPQFEAEAVMALLEVKAVLGPLYSTT